MPSFTTRVILHGVREDEQAYTDLHVAMKKAGFSRTIKGGGKEYHLPPAEYDFDGAITKAQVIDKAKAAALSVHDDFGVLVTEAVTSGQMWVGLKEV
ncbi:hypothetical protein BLA23254_05009 [Burkholderia lata]|uniref:DUF2622 domain-containing protein n=1 Tax=Burkholderia lata (strain ATCC 17760 / DSM 23089 / LMG 22485 / NCIMB 9086 / R18194 / 383) TaxID=482957 RepID=A0A6P2PC85_BURL3|nr:DUF2622 domain-containing protein [Burkholderia lata]VWC05286.1 hypothetical protein BLA23254_05009 [Burkholderia lata]